MPKRIKKRFDIDVTESNAVFSKTFELDKNITAVHGILFTGSRDDLLYYRGSNKVELNRQEIFPEGYESKLLMTGLNVSPNDRFYNLGGMVPGNGKLKVDYKDNDDERIEYHNYRVTIYLDCETNDEV
ncbi:MAG: hypothetical protein QM764_08950 [Chitinophagaceae bacterium]